MRKEPNEAERLFARLSDVAMEAGFSLREVRMTAAPIAGGTRAPVVDVRVRSRDQVDRLPSPAAVEAFFGG